MNADLRNKWVGGIFFACVAVVWGISSLISGHVVIPIRQSRFLPFYSHIAVQGWQATCISVALIAAGIWLHSGLFWSQYPKWQRPASLISLCAGWIAGTLFAIGICAWSIMALIRF